MRDLHSQSRRLRLKLFAVAALGLVTLAGSALAQTSPAQVVQERRDGLRAMGQHMEAMAAIARAGGDPRPAVERVQALEAWFRGFPARFPAGTQQGAAGIETRALPAIWQNFADFERLDQALLVRLGALREAAASGNAAAFGQALQATGASCGDCHRPYRAR
jgi:cytochrome c556